MKMPTGVWERPSVESRFWSKVEKTDGCWLWKASKSPLGYGRFWIPSEHQVRPAYRYAYELLKESVPMGKELDHLCRNRACVNPDHMEPVTHRENIMRGDSPKALGWGKSTCPKGHPLVEGNLAPYELKLGHRKCLTCKKEQRHNFWVKNRR